MTQKILITSALPYANGPLHFGHIAGAYLPGDCYARFERMKGNQVLYICGSDEYGVAITLSADLAGRTPKQQVDIFHEVNKKLFEKMHFSFDHYSRTTTEFHKEPVQEFFLDLMRNGYIEERTTDQLYSEKDKRFLADRYVIGTCPRCGFNKARGDECPDCGASYDATDLINPRSRLTNAPLKLLPTKHWFLKLDLFKDRLNEWLDSKNWKPNVINFVKGYIQDLHPRAITRDMTWGIPVPLPEAENKVFYVWFDAPIGYISATMEWASLNGQPELWKEYWYDAKTKLVQFIGKDNITFHAAIFPAMTMGQEKPYKLVDELPANEFYKLEGRQFSKSEGWYIDLEDFFTRYTSDQIRYAIAASAPETADSEFTWKEFQARCNGDLLGKFGNLVNRVMVFAKNNCQGKAPAADELKKIDVDFLENVKKMASLAEESYSSFRVRRASQVMIELAQLGNVYFDAKRPWLDAKSSSTHSSMNTTIACCLECLKTLAVIAFPIIPQTASELWKMLGYRNLLKNIQWDAALSAPIADGQDLMDPKILFKRIEDSQIEEEINKLHQLREKAMESRPLDFEPLKPAIEIDDVKKLDLRVGIVLQAVPVPKSKKLLQLEVDLGLEKRKILAGISQHYSPESIIGKKVVVVANLKPATLMGIESEGMVLAGSMEGSLEIISPENLPAGSVVS